MSLYNTKTLTDTTGTHSGDLLRADVRRWEAGGRCTNCACTVCKTDEVTLRESNPRHNLQNKTMRGFYGTYSLGVKYAVGLGLACFTILLTFVVLTQKTTSFSASNAKRIALGWIPLLGWKSSPVWWELKVFTVMIVGRVTALTASATNMRAGDNFFCLQKGQIKGLGSEGHLSKTTGGFSTLIFTARLNEVLWQPVHVTWQALFYFNYKTSFSSAWLFSFFCVLPSLLFWSHSVWVFHLFQCRLLPSGLDDIFKEL